MDETSPQKGAIIDLMAKTPRNAPCPCGSGKKFKKCCSLKPQPRAAPPAQTTSWGAGGAWTLVDDELDDLSNSVLGLVAQRRFEEALAACKRLLEEFPDVVDGLERSALVHSALGDHARAADFYRQALAYMRDRIALQARLKPRHAVAIVGTTGSERPRFRRTFGSGASRVSNTMRSASRRGAGRITRRSSVAA